MRSQSLGSVVVRSADRPAIEASVREYVAGLIGAHPQIVEIIWFGSWINGIPTPASDVDICIVLSHSDIPFRDRIPEFLPVGFPVGIDVFPYTVEEMRTLSAESPDWHRAMTSGRTVYSGTPPDP